MKLLSYCYCLLLSEILKMKTICFGEVLRTF